jgi:hypothetical protein
MIYNLVYKYSLTYLINRLSSIYQLHPCLKAGVCRNFLPDLLRYTTTCMQLWVIAPDLA